MKININYRDEADKQEKNEEVIERVCQEAALVYGLGPNAEISILLCHNEYIHELNKQYRDIDRPTDVLSFALNEGEEDGYDGPDTALLGDIVISLDKVQEQADEYGHSFERELAYLTIHGMLHILGYDHMEPDDKAEMRKEEEFILTRLGYVRPGEDL
ncbi:rRNA maturation RNase YbeY [Megasphaera hominis]|jgi:probable rRNA maturation factor|uniref:Endoribonuclease YbeY n=1 Tax=Megasphaera hominis TaxID=159836 RepID=A0ABR6VI69_9FIRM|nr:rRNA maturation RNase YbeY [Megasphaera hominis]MBC3536422.1 rRNA maturation RNase YbeY [Megasphaera hominis]